MFVGGIRQVAIPSIGWLVIRGARWRWYTVSVWWAGGLRPPYKAGECRKVVSCAEESVHVWRVGEWAWVADFSALLYPPRQQRSLWFVCRHRQRDGVTLFRMNFRVGRTLPLRRRFVVHGGPVFKDHTSPHTVLVQACQRIWLVKNHDVYQKFTYVGRTHSSLAPLRLRAGRFRLASWLCVPVIRRLRCPQSFTPSCYRLRMSG